METAEKILVEDISSLSDRQIIEQILLTGKTVYFGALYDRYANKVYRKCISMVKSREDARDLTHDILVKAFLKISSFQGNSSFSTWIYTITYNHCIDFLRQKQKNRVVEYNNVTDGHDLEEVDEIENKKLFEIEVGRLKELLFELSEDDRAIILMKYQDEMSIEQIRTVLKLSSSAVKMRLKRARDRLRKLYEKTYGTR